MVNTIIVPHGKTSLNGLKKLHKNTLSQIATDFKVLVFGGAYGDEDRDPDELYPVDETHLNECYDLYLMHDAVINCKARTLTFKNYGKTNYDEWKEYYESQLETLKGEHEPFSVERGFIKKLFNFSEYSKNNDLCAIYSIVSVLRLVCGMINKSPTLYKIILNIKVNMDGYDEELAELRKNISEDELTIEINDDSLVFTAPKREDQGTKEDTAEEKQAKEFYEMMSNMGKKLQTQMQSSNPSMDTSNGFGLINSILGADAPTDTEQANMMKMFSNMFGGSMNMNGADCNDNEDSDEDEEFDDDIPDLVEDSDDDIPDLVEDSDSEDNELDEQY